MHIIEEPILETERLILRKINVDDADDIQEIYSDKEMFVYTNSDISLEAEPFFITKKTAFVMITSWENDKELLCWGIELKSQKKLIGRVYLYGFLGNPDLGYRVDMGYSLSKKYWSNGYTTEAVREVVNYGFAKMNIIRYQAEIIPENTASIKVCEKIGFQNEGILRSYALYDNNGQCFRDIVMMALIR